MDIKFLFAVTAAFVTVFSFIPYVRDIFSGKTKPHAYTWLIWTLTQGTAVVALWYGGGGFGALSITTGFLFVCFISIFSLFRGTKNIRKVDAVALFAAVAAILVWWQMHDPLLAVLMVSAIDVVGYLPTYRKSF